MVTEFRLLQEKDARALAHLFFDSVRNGTTKFYSAEQRQAWARAVPEELSWATRLGQATTFVAENYGEIAGFMTIDNTGYIDLAFVRSDLTGQGIGSALFERVCDHAVRQGMSLLHTQASEMAKPFFAKHGFNLVKSQTINRENVALINHVMDKRLGD